MRAELIERLRPQLGAPYPAEPLKAALKTAARELSRITFSQGRRSAIYVLHTPLNGQLVRSRGYIGGLPEIKELFGLSIPQQIFLSGAQVAALGIVANGLKHGCNWDDCPELQFAYANDILLEWLQPEPKQRHAYIFAADSTGRALIARAPVIGNLTGSFRVQYRPDLVHPLFPVTLTEALRMSARYCWPN